MGSFSCGGGREEVAGEEEEVPVHEEPVTSSNDDPNLMSTSSITWLVAWELDGLFSLLRSKDVLSWSSRQHLCADVAIVAEKVL